MWPGFLRVATVLSPLPGGSPHAPERLRLAERVAVDQEEVRRTALADATGPGLADEVSAAPRRGRQRIVRLETGSHEARDLPGELVGAQRTSAEVTARGDRDAGVSGQTVTGVGMNNIERMEKIFYRAWVFLLNPNSKFSDARAATLQAATDLYGAGSNERAQVAAAWSAVFPAFISDCTHARKSLLKSAYSLRSAGFISMLWPVMIVS